MKLRKDMEDALERNKRLFLLWTTTVVLLVVSHVLIPISAVVGIVLFLAGGLSLSISGVSCAYAIVRETA